MKTKTKDYTIITNNKTNTIVEVSANEWGTSCKIIAGGDIIHLIGNEITSLIALLKEATIEIEALQKKVKQKK